MWIRAAVIVVSAVAGMLIAYGNLVRDVANIWSEHPSYSHGMLVVPAVLCLIFMRRRLIAAEVPRPAFLGLVVLSGLSFLGALAAAVSVEIVQQFIVVAMLVALVGTIVGKEVFRFLLFPLGLLFFAVPFGGEISPILQDLTAAVTVESLRLLDVPVYQEGRFLMVPGRSWEVADSCVGLQYIFPSLALGYVFAGTLFQHWVPRIVFMSASFIMPILANFVRATLIVILAQASDSRLGLGADHYAYAWVIFGLMEFSLFLVALRWRERPPVDALPEKRPVSSVTLDRACFPLRRMGLVAVCGVGIAALPVALSIQQTSVRFQSQPLSEFKASAPWSLRTEFSGEWKPLSDGALGSTFQTFSSGQDDVHLAIVFYGIQQKGDKLVNLWRPLIDRGEGLRLSQTSVPARFHGQELPVAESIVKISSNGRRYLVWSWYWIDGHITANAYYAKVLEGIARLWGRPQGAVLFLITGDQADRTAARALLQRFSDALGNIDESLHRSFLNE
jgi:exosortase A